jgi:hypothetical protein
MMKIIMPAVVTFRVPETFLGMPEPWAAPKVFPCPFLSELQCAQGTSFMPTSERP